MSGPSGQERIAAFEKKAHERIVGRQRTVSAKTCILLC